MSGNRSAWLSALEELGLDPDIDANGHPRLLLTRKLEQLSDWYGIPQAANAETNTITSEKLEKLPLPNVRRYVARHVTGESVIRDENVVTALEKRVQHFPFYVVAAEDVVVTAEDPLIISKSGTRTEFNTVTIEPGGYIKILADCVFRCQELIRGAGDQITAPGDDRYDFIIAGPDGHHGDHGDPGDTPKQSNAGNDAECDCCGGAIAHGATNGAPGKPGGKGHNGLDGDRGFDGPIAHICVNNPIEDAFSLINRGGNGGNGGAGGNGGNGGKGGNGGNGTTCGAFQPNGRAGGKGGKGGLGGNGGDGGDGGNGGNVLIKIAETSKGTFLTRDEPGRGGKKGPGGPRGHGGNGGDAGAHGGTHGAPGEEGDADGQDGQPGTDGRAGTTTVEKV
jgi:hypothetical protein